MGLTIAVDGPAAAGKGTISRALSRHFGFGHLDTGLLYRATAARALGGEDPEAAARDLGPADLERRDLRDAAVAAKASEVAAIPAVRAALLAFQRDFARRGSGAVLDGRDIGTVICPDAHVKLFVTASPEIRARRRCDELVAAGAATDYETVLADVRARDDRDMGRADAPMRPADDSVEIDTTELSIEEAVARAVAIVEAARN